MNEFEEDSTISPTLDREGLMKKFPKSAIKTRVGGGNSKLSYYQTHTIIHRLNKCAPEWNWHITDTSWRDDLCIVTGELTIPGMGTRTGIGVQKVTERGGEDLVKGGSSDALKKASTLFGVGLELYGEDYEEVSSAATKPQTLKVQAKKVEPVEEEMDGYYGEHPVTKEEVFFSEKADGTFLIMLESGEIHSDQTQPMLKEI